MKKFFCFLILVFFYNYLLAQVNKKLGITIEPINYQFGEVALWENQAAIYYIKNNNQKPVSILPLFSQNDLEIIYPDKAILPEEKAIIKAIYYTASTGSFSKKFPIYFSHSKQAAVLQVSGNIKSLSPNAYIQCPMSKPTQAKLKQDVAGIITDTDKLPLEDCNVNIIGRSNNTKEELKSSKIGDFNAKLAVGTYTISVSKTGFKPVKKDFYVGQKTGMLKITLSKINDVLASNSTTISQRKIDSITPTQINTNTRLDNKNNSVETNSSPVSSNKINKGEKTKNQLPNKEENRKPESNFLSESTTDYTDSIEQAISNTIKSATGKTNENKYKSLEEPHDDEKIDKNESEGINTNSLYNSLLDSLSNEENLTIFSFSSPQNTEKEKNNRVLPSESENLDEEIKITHSDTPSRAISAPRKNIDSIKRYQEIELERLKALEDEILSRELALNEVKKQLAIKEEELKNKEQNVSLNYVKEEINAEINQNDPSDSISPKEEKESLYDFSPGSYKANNIVFLIDVSSSMAKKNKIDFLKEAMHSLSKILRKIDKVSILAYNQNVVLLIESQNGDDKLPIQNAIDSLKTGGLTYGVKGIQNAYDLVLKNYISGGNNEIILATDGLFSSVNNTLTEVELNRLVKNNQKKHDIRLSVIGFGNDEDGEKLMHKLSNNGNGQFILINNSNQAKSQLIKEIKLHSKTF